MIKIRNKKLIFSISAMIFLLTAAFSNAALSRESQGEKQNVLRQASLEWMQIGIKQYQAKQFAEAEQSFRRALVFKKHLTEAERLEINQFLTKVSFGLSEGKPPVESTETDDKSVEQDQSVKAEQTVESSRPLPSKQQQQTKKEPRIVNSRIEQKVQSVKTAEPAMPEIQLAAGPATDVVVVKDASFKGEFMSFSDWLSENRRNILMIGLPVLGVLIIIMKLQGLKRRPGRRVYTYRVPASSSFIGARLAGDDANNRRLKGSKNRPSGFAAPATNPQRKSFEQSTDHWKEKHFGHTPDSGKKSLTSEKWPQQKDKSAAGDISVTKIEEKLCGRCKQLKPHSDFYRNKSTKDGLARWCKQCKKEYRKKRAAEKK